MLLDIGKLSKWFNLPGKNNHSKFSCTYKYDSKMLKLELQYFGHLMGRPDSLEKTLKLGKIEDKRRRGQQRMRWWDGIIDSMDMSLIKLWELAEFTHAWEVLACCSPWGHIDLDTTEQLNWTELNVKILICLLKAIHSFPFEYAFCFFLTS